MQYPECQTYSVEQAACVLGVSRSHAYAMTETGELPCIRLGYRKRIAIEVINKLLRGNVRRDLNFYRNDNYDLCEYHVNNKQNRLDLFDKHVRGILQY